MGQWTAEYHDTVLGSKMRSLVSGAIKRGRLEKTNPSISYEAFVRDLDKGDSFTTSLIEILVKEYAERLSRPSSIERGLVSYTTQRALRRLSTVAAVYHDAPPSRVPAAAAALHAARRAGHAARAVNAVLDPTEYLSAPPSELELEDEGSSGSAPGAGIGAGMRIGSGLRAVGMGSGLGGMVPGLSRARAPGPGPGPGAGEDEEDEELLAHVHPLAPWADDVNAAAALAMGDLPETFGSYDALSLGPRAADGTGAEGAAIPTSSLSGAGWPHAPLTASTSTSSSSSPSIPGTSGGWNRMIGGRRLPPAISAFDRERGRELPEPLPPLPPLVYPSARGSSSSSASRRTPSGLAGNGRDLPSASSILHSSLSRQRHPYPAAVRRASHHVHPSSSSQRSGYGYGGAGSTSDSGTGAGTGAGAGTETGAGANRVDDFSEFTSRRRTATRVLPPYPHPPHHPHTHAAPPRRPSRSGADPSTSTAPGAAADADADADAGPSASAMAPDNLDADGDPILPSAEAEVTDAADATEPIEIPAHWAALHGLRGGPSARRFFPRTTGSPSIAAPRPALVGAPPSIPTPPASGSDADTDDTSVAGTSAEPGTGVRTGGTADEYFFPAPTPSETAIVEAEADDDTPPQLQAPRLRRGGLRSPESMRLLAAASAAAAADADAVARASRSVSFSPEPAP
ncbi:hypothetical protein CONPUDRAFT_168927 [Coniophora puteana RWD-64-598 SS2]|uniref:Uncharacterized protein n=1 Tax=Coniophora puteana (strain RWD-64-598) TaxID=741705 RepID=A0A5M3MCK7_CONPW|nr:uncharacterized protein CONPUDRAFT_168927 [Coniophora puteana RWD-64-598 SS2]EIW76375.1 hypothetical protein CONPUDRAFT_168927 [Coniophora puteana RWD-64-598 SS2]